MVRSAEKTRLDLLLVERGLVPSRQKAQALILAGAVRVNGQPARKAGLVVERGVQVEVAANQPRYVSRGGWKLEGALRDLGISPAGRVTLDVGCSTGGFTDCLLQHGARQVYAVDVSPEQLDWKLRSDPRVVVVARNARYLQPADLPGPVEMVTVDVSFISTTLILPALVPLTRRGADWLILIKPQFELERGQVGRGGVVREPHLHQQTIQRVRAAAARLGLEVRTVVPSQLPGAEGNQEFFLHARTP
jgi:23S rRNA (cytidine1920-2'-O)/16S rRNA (cytidine1409-2'-O)-methyltransferase